ncbi:uncharacterized protein B0T15DRAFT_105011 [Chaetomium strumarium]|uniref:Uncharacterized protein n=1 Tax=Chaetomium strumarium TaxID=1170767 RepID=A0AAJ0GYP0_9PEZI|nr:hypothetical protein B0T15DRAFT_105011 [Chaetomium strumarium]
MLVARGYYQDSCPRISPELLQKLLLEIRDLKEMVADPRAMQRRLEACFTPSGRITGPPSSGHRYLTSIGELEHPSIVGATRTRVGVSQHTAAVHGAVPRESLQEVYDHVLLYLGQFLKNIFSLLLRYVQPSRDLGQQLLAKFNLTFLDAVGSPPRILPSEIFQSFKVFRVFVQEQFKGIPLIDRGRFLLLS